MIATVLDTATGKTETVEGHRSWDWAEGNWSCDCNRDINGLAPDPLETGLCVAKRFIVIKAEMEEGDYPYITQNLNKYYPKDLLRDFGVRVRENWNQ